MIKYKIEKIKPYGDDREIDAFIIEPPYDELSIIKGFNNIEDLTLEIEWIEELVGRNVPDFSEDGIMIYQPFLWGSKKSKVAEIHSDNKFIGGQEFNTEDFLEICYAWLDYLKKDKSEKDYLNNQ